MSLANDDYIQNLYAEIAASNDERPVLRALHLSDVHIDMQYEAGTLANCREYLCCRPEVGYPTRPGQEAAGEWGSGLCDLPVKTFQSMLDYVVQDPETLPDMIIWTGDNKSHDVWEDTEDQAVEYTIKVSTMISDAFAGKNVTVLPI